jgi:protein-disulfide isomerase
MNRRNLLLLGVPALAALGGFLWANRNAPAASAFSTAASAQEATAEQLAMVPDMVMGAADAPLTVVEYASFTCPHCANFHNSTFDEFKTNYIDTGKVRFIYREVYFDRFGLWAAMVARCGGEMKYFGIADIFYETQRDWIGDGAEATIAANLRKIGLKAGIAPDALEACLNDQTKAEAMVAAFQKHATEDGVESTPTFIIGGDKHAGDMPYADFAAILDAKLGS